MHPAPAIRPAGTADIDAVADVLTDAFATDPVLAWLFPPTLRRQRQRMRRLWHETAEDYIVKKGQPVYLTADGKGAAIWARPGGWSPSTSGSLADLVSYLSIFRVSFPKAVRFGNEVMGKHPKSPAHWYLYAIGTHTSTQGRGVGSALLRDRLDELDQTGEPAYLESSNIRNVPLYQRHGFEVVEETTVSGGGPTLWRMWREPGGHGVR